VASQLFIEAAGTPPREASRGGEYAHTARFGNSFTRSDIAEKVA